MGGIRNMLLNKNKFELIHVGKEVALTLPDTLPSSENLVTSNTTQEFGVTFDHNLS